MLANLHAYRIVLPVIILSKPKRFAIICIQFPIKVEFRVISEQLFSFWSYLNNGLYYACLI